MIADVKGVLPLYHCARLGIRKMLQVILYLGKANVNSRCTPDQLTALHFACRRVWACRTGVSPLMLAAMHGNTAVMRQLIEHGALVKLGDDNGDTACIYAARRAQSCYALRLLNQQGKAPSDSALRTGGGASGHPN